MRALYESRTASKSELDQAQASFESAEAQQAVAQKTLELARLQMEYGSLAAPFDGLVIARPVDIHQTVSAGQPVATLAANGMDMVIGLPETLVTQVRLGDPAEVTVGAAPGRLFRAAVSEIAASTGGRSTYPVRLTLQDDPGPLRSGMTGEAVLTFAAADGGVFHVPAGSVVSRPDGTRFLWIVDPGRLIVEERTVVPGALTSAGLEIREGVRAGEWVAVRGVHRLSPGTRVRILESEP